MRWELPRSEPPPGRLSRACAGLVGLALALFAGCSDLDRLIDFAFPPTVPGLPADEPWTLLPVRSWITEGDVQAEAMAACFAPACREPAGVGIFQAEGRSAAMLADLIEQPDRLRRAIESGGRRSFRRRAMPVRVAVEPLSDVPLRANQIRISRPDGSHAVFGVVMATRRPGPLRVVVVIAPAQATALRIARDVGRQLG